MKVKNLLLLTLLAIFIVGCGRPESGVDELSEVAEKQSFFIETASVGELKQSSSLSKNGILIGANTITVTSQIGGRISDIDPSIGDSVEQGSRTITLNDSAGGVSFGLERASASLEQARINYESTLLSLDQQIEETKRNIRQADLQEQGAQIQAQNSQLEGTSAARSQLQQLEQQLSTARLDLDTKIQSDQQTIDNFLNSADNILRDARLLYAEVLDESDKILGVTSLNERENNLYENNLGARNTGSKFRAEAELRRLLNQENSLDGINITQQSLSADLNYIQDTLRELTPFLDTVEEVLSFTTTGRNFSQQQLNELNQRIDGLQAQVQGQVSGITQQVNSIQSFLRVYQDQQQSIRENIDALEIQIQTTRKNLQTAERASSVSVDTAGIGKESAEARLQDLIQTRSVTEKSLRNAIRQSEIALREIQTNAGKFTVEAPIAGTIGEILVDIGQEVNPGTPLYTITSSSDLEIEIGLTSNEVDLVQEGQEVTVIKGDTEFGGVVNSITRTANQSLSYKAKITPSVTPDLLGGVVRIVIPLESNQLLLPLKNIQILTTDTGRITVYQNGTIESIIVNLGTIQGSNIVIDEELSDDLKIITSSVRTFDPEKFEVIVK